MEKSGLFCMIRFVESDFLKVGPVQTFLIKLMRLKGTVMQIEKALINDRLRVSKVS